MNLHFSFKDESAKTSDVERELQQHVQKLERHLQAFRPELVHLHGTIDHNHREGFTISLNLRLPTGQLAVQESGKAVNAAVKVAFTDLISQLKRHKELIRNEHRWRRKRKPPRGAVAEIQESVERYVSQSTHERSSHGQIDGSRRPPEVTPEEFEYGSLFKADVRKYINGDLSRVQRFIELEIRAREEDGTMEPDSLSPVEVIDEVVVSALSSEDGHGLSTEKWIYRLALDAINELSTNSDRSQLPLEEPLGEPNVRASDDEFLQYHQPGERHNREDFLANADAATPEQAAANDEAIEQLEDALRGLPPGQRHAFVLFTVEGFSIDETAQVIGRDVDAVKELINGAREQVTRKLPPSNVLKQRLIAHSDVA
jgi:RNA polymerase sigma factor (sigma-70 family)